MNSKVLAKIRGMKPIRSKAQVDLDAILRDEWVIYVSLTGYLEIFRVEVTEGHITHAGRAKLVQCIRANLGRAVYSTETETEAVALRDLACFETENQRWRLYWVRNTGLHSTNGGPTFSERHMEWVAARLYEVWKKYVNPNRRRASASMEASQ